MTVVARSEGHLHGAIGVQCAWHEVNLRKAGSDPYSLHALPSYPGGAIRA
jgi:hypothetical protein